MTVITAPSGADYSALDDEIFYTLTITKIEAQPGNPAFKNDDNGSTRVWFDCAEVDVPLSVFAGNRLGIMAGRASVLRQLVNAIRGVDPATEIGWFDSATYEFGDMLADNKTPGAALGRIALGQVVRGRVEFVPGSTPGDTVAKLTTFKATRATGGVIEGNGALLVGEPRTPVAQPERVQAAAVPF